MTSTLPKAGAIPSITILQHKLGCGSGDRKDTLTIDMKNFFKEFETKDGLSGVSLTDWKKHQSGLSELAEAFLKKHSTYLEYLTL